MGDSITHGYGVPGGYRVPLRERFVAAGIDVDFVGTQRFAPPGHADPEHEGYSAYPIDDIAPHALAAVKSFDPDVILVLAGTNDLRLRREAGAPERLLALVDAMHAEGPGATIVVGTLTPWGSGDPRVDAFNAALAPLVEARAKRWDLRLADLHGAVPAEGLEDNVHPNAAGYAAMAGAWAKALALPP